MTTLGDHVKQMLLLGRETVSQSPRLVAETGTVNAKGDRTIGMDVRVEEALVDYIKKNNIPADIFSEEIGTVSFHPSPEYIIAFDPLDGSTNYKIGKNIYPYGLLIAVYKGTAPSFRDIIASGAIEYTQNLGWLYRDGKTETLDGEPVILKNDWVCDHHTPVYLDLYMKGGYELYRPFADDLFIRNAGSTIGNLSYVLNNMAAAIGGVSFRPEEIGAVISLIAGAGGIAVDHNGKNLIDNKFTTKSTQQLVAGSPNIIEYITKKLENNVL